MYILKQAFIAVLTVSLAVPPSLASAAAANNASGSQEKPKGEEAKYEIKPIQMATYNFDTKTRHWDDMVVIVEKGTNNIVMEVTLKSSPEDLAKYPLDDINNIHKEMLIKKMQSDKDLKDLEYAQSPKELELYDAKRINEIYGAAADLKNGQNDAVEKMGVGRAFKEAGKHTVVGLLPETAKFAIALGAVNVMTMVADPSMNPVALQQTIEHQMSPLGTLGFGLFIFTNGLTTNILGPKFINNPAMLRMLPYIGMTAGFAVQGQFSQLASDPNFLACAKLQMGKTLTQQEVASGMTPKNVCRVAWNNFLAQKQTASWISMMLSTYVAAKGQGWLNSFVARNLPLLKKAGTKVMNISKLDVLLTATPSGFVVRGASFAIKAGSYVLVRIAPLVAFLGLDSLVFNRKTTFYYHNFMDAPEIHDVANELVDNVNVLQNKDWQGLASADDEADSATPLMMRGAGYDPANQVVRDTSVLGSIASTVKNLGSDSKQLSPKILEFQKKMSEWRVTNMAEVLEAHQNWSQALVQLTSMYNTSHTFYDSFVSLVRTDKFNLKPTKALRLQYPFWGVIPEGLDDAAKNIMAANPLMYALTQFKTVKSVTNYIDQRTAEGAYKHLDKKQVAKIAQIRDMLAYSLSVTQLPVPKETALLIGKGLAMFRAEYISTYQSLSSDYAHFKRGFQSGYKNGYNGDLVGLPTYLDLLQEIRARLGDVNPQLEPGRGALLALEEAPENKEAFKDTAYYKGVGFFGTPRISDYMMMQMICGPDVDKGEKVVRDSFGFQSVFVPPRLRSDDNVIADGSNTNLQNECGSPMAYAEAEKIYTWPLQVQSAKNRGGMKVPYRGFLSYLTENMRSSVLGTADDNGNDAFETWWKKNSTRQISNAFADYSVKYQAIVAKLVKSMFDVERPITNQTFVANSVVPSIVQEELMYLSVLQQMINPPHIFNPVFGKIEISQIQDPDLKEVHAQFMGLVNLLKSIRVVQKNTQEVFEIQNPELRSRYSPEPAKDKSGKLLMTEVVQSPVKNSDLKAQSEAINAALEKVKNKMGLNPQDIPEGSFIAKANGIAGTNLTNANKAAMNVDGVVSYIRAKVTGIADVVGIARQYPTFEKSKTKSDAEKSAEALLGALNALTMELSNYGTIANAVSWDKLRESDDKNLKTGQAQYDQNTQNALKANKGATSVGH